MKQYGDYSELQEPSVSWNVICLYTTPTPHIPENMPMSTGAFHLAILFISLVARPLCVAGPIPVLDRLFASASVGDDVKSQMRSLRDAALRLSVVSDPVSDRYLITELGGPIDLVHFLGLATEVFSAKKTVDAALWDQYVDEGGLDYEKRKTHIYPTEARPDDLPSNAFGALFGSELLAAKQSGNLRDALEAFLLPLKPMPDEVMKRYSHNQIVMGSPQREVSDINQSRHEWFTAHPLLVSRIIAEPQMRFSYAASENALALAGFELVPIKGRMIKITRKTSAGKASTQRRAKALK